MAGSHRAKARRREREPRSNLPAVVENGDAIGELLGRPAEPPPPLEPRSLRRQSRWMLAGVPALALLMAAGFWLHYKLTHVTSKNAAVRGHVSEMGTRISGRVAQVTVDAGDRVEANQVLVQLEDRHLLAEVGEARAELEGLEQRIEVERATITMAQRETGQRGPEGRARIASAKARAEGARIEAENAQSKHQIQEALHARDRIVSDEELRASDAQRRAAAARLAEAQANAVVVEQEARQAGETVSIRARGLAVLEANLAAAQARLNRAIADLESAAIRAPQAGAIIRRIVQPGASVIAGQPVISMWLGEELWVEAWIEEEDLRHVKTGNRATVTFHSLPGQFTGRVARVNLSTDMEVPESDVPQPRSSRLSSAPVLGVRIRLDELPPDLVPGLSAVVAIETGS